MKRLLAADLYRYLLKLMTILQQRGAVGLFQRVYFASRFVSSLTTSEFLQEAAITLKSVQTDHGTLLNEREISERQSILQGIDYEFWFVGQQ